MHVSVKTTLPPLPKVISYHFLFWTLKLKGNHQGLEEHYFINKTVHSLAYLKEKKTKQAAFLPFSITDVYNKRIEIIPGEH